MHCAPGFVSDESSSLWFLEELSRNEEPSRWIPDLVWTHEFRQFWRFWWFCGNEIKIETQDLDKRLASQSRPPTSWRTRTFQVSKTSSSHWFPSQKKILTAVKNSLQFSQYPDASMSHWGNSSSSAHDPLFWFRSWSWFWKCLGVGFYKACNSLALTQCFVKCCCVFHSAFATPPMWCWWWWCAADSDISSQWMGFGAKPDAFPRPLPHPQPLCHNPGLTSTNSDSTSNQVFVSFSQKRQNCIMLVTNCISTWNVCVRNIFAKVNRYHHSQHPNSLYCPLHWWSFRDQVNICWNHTKPNCNARNRADSINHTSNLYVEICLYVPENGYWNQIIHSIHSVYCGWKNLSKLVVLIKTLRMILREGRHFFEQGTLCLWNQWCFSSIQFYL